MRAIQNTKNRTPVWISKLFSLNILIQNKNSRNSLCSALGSFTDFWLIFNFNFTDSAYVQSLYFLRDQLLKIPKVHLTLEFKIRFKYTFNISQTDEMFKLFWWVHLLFILEYCLPSQNLSFYLFNGLFCKITSKYIQSLQRNHSLFEKLKVNCIRLNFSLIKIRFLIRSLIVMSLSQIV